MQKYNFIVIKKCLFNGFIINQFLDFQKLYHINTLFYENKKLGQRVKFK